MVLRTLTEEKACPLNWHIDIHWTWALLVKTSKQRCHAEAHPPCKAVGCAAVRMQACGRCANTFWTLLCNRSRDDRPKMLRLIKPT